MVDQIVANNTCELLYKLRDAVLSNNIPLALMMCREVHERLTLLSARKEAIDCSLQCDIKETK